jgi:hypothetical protein
VFSRDALARHPDLIYREARILHQAMQRWQAPNSNVFHGVDPLQTAADNSGFQPRLERFCFGRPCFPKYVSGQVFL